jgi:nitrogen regulatory protein P-II 1
MKKIECIIQNKKIGPLEAELRAAGVGGLTVYEVKGFGNERTRPEAYLFLPKTKVEIFCKDSEVDHLVDIILKICQSGQLGDGKLVVTDLERVIRLRTGQTGDEAI